MTAGFFCKSFAPDFKHLDVMLSSFSKHNPDNLPLTLSLPRADIAAFINVFGATLPNLRLVADEDYCPCDLATLPGWYGQQLCKLTSWRATGTDRHIVIDSDSYFIADVGAADFMPAPGKKRIVWGSALRTVFEPTLDKTLVAYINGEWNPGDEHFPPVRPAPALDFAPLRALLPEDAMSVLERSGAIFRFFGAQRWYSYQPGQIFEKAMLIAFEDCMRAGGLTLADVIRIAPWEYNWYGEYIGAFHNSDTDFRISPVFHIAKQAAVDLTIAQGVTEQALKRRFKWVQMASRHLDLLKF